MSKLNQIESDALQFVQVQYPELSELFASQMPTLTVFDRENSGKGHYSYFTNIMERAESEVSGFFGSGFMEVEGLKNGVGFMVRIEAGKIDLLEIYSFGESTEGIDFDDTAYELISPGE